MLYHGSEVSISAIVVYQFSEEGSYKPSCGLVDVLHGKWVMVNKCILELILLSEFLIRSVGLLGFLSFWKTWTLSLSHKPIAFFRDLSSSTRLRISVYLGNGN